jgi:hypothetical protein
MRILNILSEITVSSIWSIHYSESSLSTKVSGVQSSGRYPMKEKSWLIEFGSIITKSKNKKKIMQWFITKILPSALFVKKESELNETFVLKFTLKIDFSIK